MARLTAAGLSKLYLSGIEMGDSAAVLRIGNAPNCTLVELKSPHGKRIA